MINVALLSALLYSIYIYIDWEGEGEGRAGVGHVGSDKIQSLLEQIWLG